MSNKVVTKFKFIDSIKNLNTKVLAILLDPDKIDLSQLPNLIIKIKESPATHIFVGGSLVRNHILEELILYLKNNLRLPIILFPGDPSQISKQADGILFLSLLSGRNPDYLIEYQVNAVSILKSTNLDIVSTAYLLIDGGKETAVQRISKTLPMDNNNIKKVVDTAIASEWLGFKCIYLEAGSGALSPVPLEMISEVKNAVNIPVIVGGGLRNYNQIKQAYASGADVVVVGTAFEDDIHFFENLKC